MRGGGLSPHDRKVPSSPAPYGPPRASGCMTAPSLQNTMTAKEKNKEGHGDKSLCSLHAVPLDSREVGQGRRKGLLRFYR